MVDAVYSEPRGPGGDTYISGSATRSVTSHRIPFLLFSVSTFVALHQRQRDPRASGELFAHSTAMFQDDSCSANTRSAVRHLTACASTFLSWPPCQTYSCDSRNALPPSYPTVRHLPLWAPQKSAIVRADGEMARTWRPVPVAVRSTLAEDECSHMQI
ncbi:hypothetical protein DFH11DRAFT_1640926 [Phellopilus nigrolimitatus]|nr:hypothetical protein DFH11DRAFT_1640926 [Phellopilus nigrolimitatus]